jgi:DNA (cytosine-5)-methyltransferase 1
MVSTYYNEHDKFNVEWLKHLMAEGVIAPGEIDGRDIQQVRAEDLRGFTQCHFFAGIGVWSYALRQAGWKDSECVWTGSCPCQPFSVSGKRAGASDERHLWPEFFRLIKEQAPIAIFGEQVASDDGLAWLDLVSSDLEGQGYTVGAVDTPACGFGAPHRRQRLYWVADAFHRRAGWASTTEQKSDKSQDGISGSNGADGFMAHSDGRQPGNRGIQRSGEHGLLKESSGVEQLAHSECDGGRSDLARRGSEGREAHGWDRKNGLLEITGFEQAGRADTRSREDFAAFRPRPSNQSRGSGATNGMDDSTSARRHGAGQRPEDQARNETRVCGPESRRSLNGFWRTAEWLYCRDEKYRPVEPSTFPLAHGVANRVGKLRGYGNALVAPQAEAFIRAFMEVSHEQIELLGSGPIPSGQSSENES